MNIVLWPLQCFEISSLVVNSGLATDWLTSCSKYNVWHISNISNRSRFQPFRHYSYPLRNSTVCWIHTESCQMTRPITPPSVPLSQFNCLFQSKRWCKCNNVVWLSSWAFGGEGACHLTLSLCFDGLPNASVLLLPSPAASLARSFFNPDTVCTHTQYWALQCHFTTPKC